MRFFIALGAVVAIGALIWRWLNRRARLMNEYFLAAAASYFLFDDQRARLAAFVAGATAEGEARDAVVAVLIAIEQLPDTMALLFLGAAKDGDSVLTGTTTRDWASIIRSRAGHLRADVMGFDGNLIALRQRLFKEAPDYERALGGFTKVDPAVFPRLRAEGLARLVAFFTL